MALFHFILVFFSIVCMYHTFFTHSDVNGHLGAFHILTIVNTAALDIVVHKYFQINVCGLFYLILKWAQE